MQCSICTPGVYSGAVVHPPYIYRGAHCTTPLHLKNILLFRIYDCTQKVGKGIFTLSVFADD